MKQSDAHWKITLLHSLQEVRAIYKTRNQLRDIICTPCKDDECEAPDYATAAEVAAVRAGDYHFPGLGLSPQDHACLAARRAARKSPTAA